MIGATYQRCSRGCGLICNHENVQDHERHCTGEERLEDCLGLPDVPNIRWHQTNAEETETANLPENLENLVVCVDDAYGPKTGPPSLIFCILSRRTAVQDSRPCGGGVSGVGRSLGVGGGARSDFLVCGDFNQTVLALSFGAALELARRLWCYIVKFFLELAKRSCW